MANTGVYKFTFGSNNIVFTLENYQKQMSRDIWEMPIPFVKEQLLLDQTTTVENIQITGKITTGSGYAYNSISTAVTACEAIMADDIITEGSLVEVSINGSTPTGEGIVDISTTTLLMKELSYSLSISEALTFMTVNITLTKGGVL